MTAPTPNSETIERELAALGEAPPSAEELALIGEELDEIDEIAHVARLLGEPLEFDELSQLETHRGWRTVEQRLASRQQAAPSEGTEQAQRERPDPRRWWFAALGLAAAAALVLIVVRPSIPEQADLDPVAVAELGERARTTLKALDGGASATQRAEQLAAEYQQRLEEQGG